MRYLIILLAALALVLGACEADDGSSAPAGVGDTDASFDLFPSAGASGDLDDDDGDDASPTGSPAGSMSATDETASPAGSAPATPRATATATATARIGDDDDDDDDDTASAVTCEAAFAEVPDLTRLDSLRQLHEALDALDETIRACDSVDEWTRQAEDQLGFANLALDAESFLEARCEESDDLDETELCEEL